MADYRSDKYTSKEYVPRDHNSDKHTSKDYNAKDYTSPEYNPNEYRPSRYQETLSRDGKPQTKYMFHNAFKILHDAAEEISWESRGVGNGIQTESTSYKEQEIQEAIYRVALWGSKIHLSMCLLPAIGALFLSWYLIGAGMAFVAVFLCFGLLFLWATNNTWPSHILLNTYKFTYNTTNKRHYNKYMPVWNGSMTAVFFFPAATLYGLCAFFNTEAAQLFAWGPSSFSKTEAIGKAILESDGDLRKAAILLLVALAFYAFLHYSYMRKRKKKMKVARADLYFKKVYEDVSNSDIAQGIFDGKFDPDA
jgi:hypothetical protein